MGYSLQESTTTTNNEDLLLTLYDSNILTNNFKIINIGTLHSLDINEDTFENEVQNFTDNFDSLEKALQVKTFSLVYTCSDNPEEINIHKFNTSHKENIDSRNKQIAYAATYFISEKSPLMNGQIIYIDMGQHLIHTKT